MTKNNQLNDFVSELAQKNIKNSEQFLNLKKKLISQTKIQPPNNTTILSIYRELKEKENLSPNYYFEKKLKKRPIRSLSGVAVVSVLTSPRPFGTEQSLSCPHHCLYCPTEKGIPKSYLSGEPAVERAKKLSFDPFWQVKKRIEVLAKNGHPTDKIELIVIGGTWSYLPTKYQTWFIKRCFDGANRKVSKNLNQAQKLNEKGEHRIIGITLETRPDYINAQEIKKMRELGCTRVELGVQNIDDKILKQNQRGHSINETIKATELLKDTGFRVCYHIMPGMFGATVKKDLIMFKKLFSLPNFQPDMLKIYPCVV
ncbi:MAG: radical SAM protein, partial [Patescibacteria group bacterium]|nr:radical SAM protein [Patescibacteria group bacterium]